MYTQRMRTNLFVLLRNPVSEGYVNIWKGLTEFYRFNVPSMEIPQIYWRSMEIIQFEVYVGVLMLQCLGAFF